MKVPTLVGVDPAKHKLQSGGGLYARNLVRGRMFEPRELRGALISETVARAYGKEPGATINVLDEKFTVTGTFRTDSPVFDGVVLAHADTVRSIAELSTASVSMFFVEPQPGVALKDLNRSLTGAGIGSGAEFGTTDDWIEGGDDFVSGMDAFLVAAAIAMALVAALGVAIALVSSVRDRAPELRLLRRTGTTSRGVFFRISSEALFFGSIGSALGVVFGAIGARLGAAIMPLTPATPWVLLVVCFVGGDTRLRARGGSRGSRRDAHQRRVRNGQ